MGCNNFGGNYFWIIILIIIIFGWGWGGNSGFGFGNNGGCGCGCDNQLRLRQLRRQLQQRLRMRLWLLIGGKVQKKSGRRAAPPALFSVIRFDQPFFTGRSAYSRSRRLRQERSRLMETDAATATSIMIGMSHLL